MKRQRTSSPIASTSASRRSGCATAADACSSRVVGLAPERARVSADHVKQDFGMNTVEGSALVDEFVAEGLLQPRAERQGDYFLTERFVEVASARVVEPLPRDRAKLLVARAAELATRINAECDGTTRSRSRRSRSFGSYMSLDDELGDLELAVVVRARDAVRRIRAATRWPARPTGRARSAARFAS